MFIFLHFAQTVHSLHHLIIKHEIILPNVLLINSLITARQRLVLNMLFIALGNYAKVPDCFLFLLMI